MKVFYIGDGLVDPELLVRGEHVLSINSISHGLASKKRFAGQSDRLEYDVLQHSVAVADYARTLADSQAALLKNESDRYLLPRETELWGLLHDASEAVMSDVASPVKKTDVFTQYRHAEDDLLWAYQKHYVPSLFRPSTPKMRLEFVNNVVHKADLVRLGVEGLRLLPEEALNNILDSALSDSVRDLLNTECRRLARTGADPLMWRQLATPKSYFPARVQELQREIETWSSL
jgi:5'-deoxynucleotidase YfbR-like HD superfamily hydrolase